MMHPENLRPGMFVALVRCRRERLVQKGFFTLELGPEQHNFDGTPLEVLEISYPFVAVRDGSRVYAIDLREWDVSKVSARYAKAMQATPAEAATLSARRQNRRRGKSRLADTHDTRLCPRCGSRMLERLLVSANPDKRGWFLICPTCDYNAGPAAQAAER